MRVGYANSDECAFAGEVRIAVRPDALDAVAVDYEVEGGGGQREVGCEVGVDGGVSRVINNLINVSWKLSIQ